MIGGRYSASSYVYGSVIYIRLLGDLCIPLYRIFDHLFFATVTVGDATTNLVLEGVSFASYGLRGFCYHVVNFRRRHVRWTPDGGDNFFCEFVY